VKYNSFMPGQRERERGGRGFFIPQPPLLFRCIFLPIFHPSFSASLLNRHVIRFRSTARLRFVRLLWPLSTWNNFAKGFDLFGRVIRSRICNTLYQTVQGMFDVENRKLRDSKLKNMIYNLSCFALKIKVIVY